MNDNSTRMIIDDPDAAKPVAEAAPPPDDPAAPPPPPNLEHVVLFVQDIAVPRDSDEAFEVTLPQPAEFLDAYKAQKGSERVLRMVWAVRAGGRRVRTAFMLLRKGIVWGIPRDESRPVLLKLIAAGNGDPIAIWQLPPDPVEEAIAEIATAPEVPT